MGVLNLTILQNEDLALLSYDVEINAGEQHQLSESPLRELPITYWLQFGWMDQPDNYTNILHFERIEGEGRLELQGPGPDGWNTNQTETSTVFWVQGGRLRSVAEMSLKSAGRSIVRVTWGVVKRGTNWLRKNWRCETCKLVVRAILNAAFTSVGIPPPDLLDFVPDALIESLLQGLMSLLGPEHPITQFIQQKLMSDGDGRIPRLGALVEWICQWLQVCPQTD